MNKILTFDNFHRLTENDEKTVKQKVTDGQYIICFALTSNMPDDYTNKDEDWDGEKKECWAKELNLSTIDRGQWYMHAGMNKETMRRMFEKYRMLFHGNREGAHNEVLFPRIIEWFDKLMKMDKAEVVKLANKALDEAPVVKDAQEEKIKAAKTDAATKAQVTNDFMKAVQGPFKGDREKAAKFFAGKVSKTPKEFLTWIGK